jgi:hypothetical protein
MGYRGLDGAPLAGCGGRRRPPILLSIHCRFESSAIGNPHPLSPLLRSVPSSWNLPPDLTKAARCRYLAGRASGAYSPFGCGRPPALEWQQPYMSPEDRRPAADANRLTGAGNCFLHVRFDNVERTTQKGWPAIGISSHRKLRELSRTRQRL